MWNISSLVRRAALGGAVVVAVGAPTVVLADACPSSPVGCTADITGKRYVAGQEVAVRCRATAGHTATYRPADPELGRGAVVIARVSGEDPACAGIHGDLRPPEEPELGSPRAIQPASLIFEGGSEERLNAKGKSTNSCVLAMTNVDATTEEHLSLSSHGHLAGAGKLAEGSLDGIKADVMYRRSTTAGPVAFIGTLKLACTNAE